MTSTKNSERVCFAGPLLRTSYCGRGSAPIREMREATCADCFAALRADERANKDRSDR